MRVLLLSGRFGFGHEMAANAVREELERQDGKIEIVQKDLPSYFYPRASRIIYKVFGLVAERYHKIYNLVCRISDRMNSGGKQKNSAVCRKFQKMMEEYVPDLIVCTHPFCEKAAAAYKIKTGSQIPLVTCITDISVRMEWFTRQTDIYLVPAMEVKDHLAGLGVTRENILATGVPVRQQFLAKKHAGTARHEAGKEKGIERRVLIMGGGLGIMPELGRTLETLHGLPGIHTTVITGKNRKLLDRWKDVYDDVEVLGYVEDVGSHMDKADLVISKAGGVTLFELLHSKAPMFIIRPFLEQEITNARYAQGKGFAQVIWEKEEDGIAELRTLLEHPEKLEEMKACMEEARHEMMDTELSEAVGEMLGRASEYLSAFNFINAGRMQLETSVSPVWSFAGQAAR